MRKAYSTQLRFDTVPIANVELNLECRDAIVPVLRALQHVYANRQLTREILGRIADDINGESRADTGCEHPVPPCATQNVRPNLVEAIQSRRPDDR